MSKWTNSSIMRRLGVPHSIYLIMIINTMNALAQEPVSYHTVRIDTLMFLSKKRAEERPGPSSAPRRSNIFPHVSAVVGIVIKRRASPHRPDFPGFGHSSWPDPKEFTYTFDHLAQVTEKFADAAKAKTLHSYLHDYGGPVGSAHGSRQPEKVEAIIIQNAVSHEEGLSPLWAARRAFWQDRASHEAAFRKSFSRWSPTRNRHLARRHILNELIPTPGRTSSTS